MGSSPGFGSTPCDFTSAALFRLAFAMAPPVTGLTWPQRVTRRLILQEARGQPFPFQAGIVLPLLVSIRFQVLFHSAHRGSFHLSLTVLVHYRSSRVFSLGRWAARFPTGLACPVVLKNPASGSRFRLRDCHPLCLAFQHSSASHDLVTLSPLGWGCRHPTTPLHGSRLLHTAVWAFPLSLATTQGMFSLPGVLRCFSSRRAPRLAYVFSQR